jgi:hypothetical protein
MSGKWVIAEASALPWIELKKHKAPLIPKDQQGVY